MLPFDTKKCTVMHLATSIFVKQRSNSVVVMLTIAMTEDEPQQAHSLMNKFALVSFLFIFQHLLQLLLFREEAQKETSDQIESKT